MLSNKSLSDIREFFGSNEFYETGFGEAILSCGIRHWESDDELIRACTYLKGYADACRLANTYMDRHWKTANLIGVIAASLVCYLDSGMVLSEEMVNNNLLSFKSELTTINRGECA